jgi:hypothetical protein
MGRARQGGERYELKECDRRIGYTSRKWENEEQKGDLQLYRTTRIDGSTYNEKRKTPSVGKWTSARGHMTRFYSTRSSLD